MPMSLEPMVAAGSSALPSARRRSGSSPGRGDDAGDVDSVGTSDAYAQLVRMAEQQRRDGETSSAAFMRVYLDDANKHLAEAERAANRPRPTTIFPMPGSAPPGRDAYAKSDPVPNTDTAYAELMAKAEAYRSAHPGLSISQAFEQVFTAPANRELAKRERLESAPS
jgi:hypothetical protein